MTEPVLTVADSADAIARVAASLSGARLLAIDVESNGLHAYRAGLCTLQIGVVTDDGDDVASVELIDPIVAARGGGDLIAILAPLRAALGPTGPRKIVHDLAFDARILARHGLPLGNLFDTSLAARFLGVQSTSLAAIAHARLGVTLSKALQHHDWGRRPLGPELFPYLAADVAHLPRLARALEAELLAKGVIPELETELDWRLRGANAALDDDDPRPPYVRIKGAQELDPRALAVLRGLADVREHAARKWDVPPFKVVGNDVLLQIARRRPPTASELRATRGLDHGRGASLVGELLAAIARGVRDGDVPPDERLAWWTPPPPVPRELVDARRAREHRLSSWRRAEAKRRGVDEQVVLPGHCMQELADRAPLDLAALATIGGIGQVRLERDAAAILGAIAGPVAGANAKTDEGRSG
ncbi:MAG: ribonuclease D [Polyangiales bacterium]